VTPPVQRGQSLYIANKTYQSNPGHFKPADSRGIHGFRQAGKKIRAYREKPSPVVTESIQIQRMTTPPLHGNQFPKNISRVIEWLEKPPPRA